MATPDSGYRTLLELKTENLILTIKGGLRDYAAEKDSSAASLRLVSRDALEAVAYLDEKPDVKGEDNISLDKLPPAFFEQTNYQFYVEYKGDKDVELSFNHDNMDLRKKIGNLGSHKNILNGPLNFVNDIGYSDIVIEADGLEILKLTIEVFPGKIGYRDDYVQLVDDVTKELYALIFDFMQNTYRRYKVGDKFGNTPAEFFAIISHIFDKLLTSTDILVAHPHHVLEKEHVVLPSHKAKRLDGRSLRYIEKHGVLEANNDINFEKVLAVKKFVTYDTNENRFTKFMLEGIVRKLNSFKDIYLKQLKNSYYGDKPCDQEIINQLDYMVGKLKSRTYQTFLRNVDAKSLKTMSLVFTMAPGYRELYKYYLMLMRSFSIAEEVHKISVKDIARLYEYWCFLKLHRLLQEKYHPRTMDGVSTSLDGLKQVLDMNKSSEIKYSNDLTDDELVLSYNQDEKGTPTTSQKPDNVLALTKHERSSDKDAPIRKTYKYVFDAKYKIDPKTGFATDNDINTMHRYRDALVEKGKDLDFKRAYFGAYVLFPFKYKEGEEADYKKSRYYQSIASVNIGALPFLPSCTGIVEDFLSELVEDSSETAFERASLPIGIEEKLKKVDWSKRDVLIIPVDSEAKLEGYHKYAEGKAKLYSCAIEKNRISLDRFPVHYIALYKQISAFKAAGIEEYGEVVTTFENETQYIFKVRKWEKLDHRIEAKNNVVVTTNMFLLQNSLAVPELSLQNEDQYRLYHELNRFINNLSEAKLGVENTRSKDGLDSIVNAFEYKDLVIGVQDGIITFTDVKARKPLQNISLAEFKSRPQSTFKAILKEVEGGIGSKIKD